MDYLMGMWVWPSESRRDDVSGQRSYSKSYSLFPDLLLFTSVVHFHLGPITGTCKMANHSIVEYFGDSGGHRCGYCNSSDTNFSHGKPSSITVATPFLVNSLLANCKTVYSQNCLLVRESLYTLVSLANPKNGKYTPPAANFGFS